MTFATRGVLIGAAIVAGCILEDGGSEATEAPSWRSVDTEDVEDVDDGGGTDAAPLDMGVPTPIPAPIPAVDAYPESNECGYSRRINGEINGRTVYGEPVLDQNNCGEGFVCGRPSLDACTEQAAEHFTCGCQPAAAACDAASLGGLLASPDYHLREDATRRAKDCCVALEYPAWVEGLGTVVDGLSPASLEASTRFEGIADACVPGCTAKTTFHPYPLDLQLESEYGGFYSCAVQKACRGGLQERTKVIGEYPAFSCSCACEAKPGK